MSFIEQIGNGIGNIKPSFVAVMFGKNSIHFEGVISLIKFEKEEVYLKLKNALAFVEGSNLLVKDYSNGDITISGNIASVKFE